MTTASLDRFHTLPESYIDSEEDLAAFLTKERHDSEYSACAIDTEADSMHSYETKLCLIQFATASELAVIDPLAFSAESLAAFAGFVDRFEITWMHGADYDISMFKKTFQWVPKRIFDTQIAARFLGADKFGLANLLESHYGVVVSKQSQKADWSKRPLTETMLAYAYNDVRYLLDLGATYLERLQAAGRLAWFEESCTAARETVMNRDGRSEEELWRITGWGNLSSKGLHFLKALWYWRDEECAKLDRPAFKFVGNAEILRMAIQLETEGMATPPHFLRERHVQRLHEAISAARTVSPRQYPSRKLPPSGQRLDIDENYLEKIRAHRNQVAAQLGIEGTLIATRGVMEMLAAANISASEKDVALLTWQRELLQECLR